MENTAKKGEDMRIRLTLRPGQNGAKQLQAQHGDRLVCVRYRYDARQQKRFKTVELIVEEREWQPDGGRWVNEQLVGVRIEVGGYSSNSQLVERDH